MPNETPAAVVPDYSDSLTPDEAAARLKVTGKVVRDWLTVGVTIHTAAGRSRVALGGVKLGGRWRIPPAALAAFIEATTSASLSPDAVPSGGLGAETDAQFRRRARLAGAAADEWLNG